MDPRVRELLRLLNRGGRYAVVWVASEERKTIKVLERGKEKEREVPTFSRSYWYDAETGYPGGLSGLRPDLRLHHYFCVSPLREVPEEEKPPAGRPPRGYLSQTYRREGGKSAVAALSAVFLDLDVKPEEAAAGKPGAFATLEDALTALAAAPLAPSAVVASGGGAQAYWLLDEPIVTDDGEGLAQAETLLRAWVRRMNGDPAATNANRLLRLPGSVNVKEKYGPSGAPVELLEFNPSRLYSEADIIAAAPREYAEELTGRRRSGTNRRRVYGGGLISVEPTMKFAGLVGEEVALELLSHIDSQKIDYPDWLAVVYAVAQTFQEEQATALLEAWTDGLDGRVEDLARRDYGWTWRTPERLARRGGWKGNLPDVDEYEVGQAGDELPNITKTSQRYVSFELPAEGETLIVRSPYGTGKSWGLKERLKPESLPEGARVLFLGHRRALLREQAEKFGLAYYEDDGAVKSDRLAITVDSALKLPDPRFDIVVIDEVEQVAQHMTGATIKDKVVNVYNRVRAILARAGRVVAMDADAGGLSSRWLQLCRPEAKISSIVNEYRPGGRRFLFYPSDAALLVRLYAMLEEGKRVFVAANTRSQANAVDALVREKYPDLRVLTITSDNSSTDIAQDFLTNATARSLELDVLVTSPAVGTGVSIDTPAGQEPHFDSAFVFGENLRGVGTYRDLLQQAHRVRQLKTGDVHCYVSSRRSQEETRRERVKPAVMKDARDNFVLRGAQEHWPDAGDIGSGLDNTVAPDERDYLELKTDVVCLDNSSRNNFIDLLMGAVKALGYGLEVLDPTVIDQEQAKEVRAEAKEVKKAAKAAWVEKVLAAPLLPDHKAEPLRENAKDDDERAAYQLWRICKDYGLEKEQVTAELVRRDEKGLFGRVKFLACIESQAYAEELDELQDRRDFRANARNRVLGRQFLLELLNEAGMPAGLDHQGPIEPPSSFVAWGLQHKERLASLLGISLDQNFVERPMTLVKSALQRVGLDTAKPTRRKVAGKVRLEHRLNEPLREEVRGYARLVVDRWNARGKPEPSSGADDLDMLLE